MSEVVVPEDRIPDSEASGAGSAALGRTRLPRQMGTLAVVLTVMAYVSPLAGVAGYVPLVIGYGNGLGAPLMFLAAGLVLLLFSVGYTTIVRRVPRPGAFYAYISAGLGRRIGLGAGSVTATYYLLSQVSFYFFGSVTMQSVANSGLGIDLPYWVYLVAFMAVVSFCTYRGMDFNVRVVGIIVALEVVIILVFNVATLVRGGPSGYPTETFTLDAFTSGPIAVAALFAINLFSGFETTAVYREEVRDPGRTIPRATYTLVVVMCVFNALAAWCLITALGGDAAVATTAADPAGSFTTALAYAMGNTFTHIVSALLVTSLVASQISIANASSRYLYSFGVDRVLPSQLSAVHRRHGSPYRAALVNLAIVASVVALIMIIGTAPAEVYVVFSGVVIFAFEGLMLLVSLAVVVHFARTGRQGESVWKVVVAPVLSAGIFGWLIVFTARRAELLLGEPTALAPILFVLIGMVFVVGVAYASWQAVRRPERYYRIGRVDA